MSRYYDALREAGRSADLAQAAQPTVPSPNPIQAPAVEENGFAADHVHTPEAPVDPAAVLSGLPLTVPVQFQPSARLLPNAANGLVLEQYRKLRTKILQQNQIQPFRTLAITSPGPQEGKTVTALNLALSFGMLPDYKVLVVDADVRKGSVGYYLGVTDAPGFSNVIEGTTRMEDVIRECAECPVHVLLHGNSSIPPERLFSNQIEVHFWEMAQRYDLVIVDTPPVNLIADSQIITSKCDAALLIARAFSTTRDSLEKAIHELNGIRIIGAVLNRGMKGQIYSDYAYKGYY